MTTTFEGLGLALPILKALTTEGYVTPTPIQMQAIPHVMQGRDVQGIAQTGTGKTAAFALPILHRLLADKRPAKPRSCRVLVLSPTRELASQIVESFRSYGRNAGLRTALIFGGVPKGRQAKAMAGGVDVLVATPGRLLDHMHDGAVQLGSVEVLVLDEADHMLDLGFIVPIRKIVSTIPTARQTLFFSATMPKEISALAGSMLKDPVHVAVTPVATTAERVEQKVIFVETARKRIVLAEILKRGDMGRTLVFTRTKHGANRRLGSARQGDRDPEAGGHPRQYKSQNARQRTRFDAVQGGHVAKVLVATDVAVPRHRRRRHLARHQLRASDDVPRSLRAPHRPHRPRRAHRHRDQLLRQHRTRLPPRHREAHPPAPHRRRTRTPRRLTETSRARPRGFPRQEVQPPTPQSTPRGPLKRRRRSIQTAAEDHPSHTPPCPSRLRGQPSPISSSKPPAQNRQPKTASTDPFASFVPFVVKILCRA